MKKIRLFVCLSVCLHRVKRTSI